MRILNLKNMTPGFSLNSLCSFAANRYSFSSTSFTQESAAETAGKPIVLVSRTTACRTSSGFAPAATALRTWEWTEPSDLMAAAAAIWTSSEVFLFSGPAAFAAFPRLSTALISP